jgi:hypothetical protein
MHRYSLKLNEACQMNQKLFETSELERQKLIQKAYMRLKSGMESIFSDQGSDSKCRGLIFKNTTLWSKLRDSVLSVNRNEG